MILGGYREHLCNIAWPVRSELCCVSQYRRFAFAKIFGVR